MNEKKRLVLAGASQVANLVRGNPAIVQQVPKLSPLLNSPQASRETPTASGGCGCKRNNNTANTQASSQGLKSYAENILSTLSTDDFIKIKNVLGLAEICYYTRNNQANQLELVCT
jgi:hypothetical protein